ncbi:MAG: TetR/AcrR family transcriptional regulator [Candidatus Thiodiazotropha sp. (ex Epidulcina cf. delphinae)]|nr:TetR/AcrR family transcriptional regulator [Candidatus Thiodiazotropha sp. (ex Epidulcina cf. delphinae)]MCU7928098.1 TetR/AcrR family transcriptional regulator [Candidatus Thiodiazotropha sp. (ex Dulcina madagascariensis)]
MAQTDKSTYHHGNLKQDLMESAVKRLAKGGIENLSLRSISREIGVSQTAPYRHFSNKNELLVALAIRGFEELTHEMVRADRDEDICIRLQQISIAYISYARKNPEIYRLLFGTGIVDRDDYQSLCVAGDETYFVLVNLIDEGIKSGAFRNMPTMYLANSVWSLVHGLATLIIDDNFSALGEALIAEQLDASVAFLVAGATSKQD